MEQIDVVAVVGICTPERRAFAQRLALETTRMLVPAQRLAMSPDPVDEAAALVPWCDRPAGALCEFPSSTIITDLIGTFADPEGRTSLTSVICVVDATHLLDDLGRDTYAYQPQLPWQRDPASQHDGSGQYNAHALLAVAQLEFASSIVLVNWESLPTAELSTVMALVSHLSPRARLRLEHDGPAIVGRADPRALYTERQDRPGWLGILSGDHDPHMTDPRVSAFRYENLRPFHPGRLERLLDDRIDPGHFGTVIRSAGFCRFATRAAHVAHWEHVGHMISFEPFETATELGRDIDTGEEPLAFGQDIAFIGLDLRHDELRAALDAATLTNEEFAADAAAWAALPDPFPAWPIASHRAE